MPPTSYGRRLFETVRALPAGERYTHLLSLCDYENDPTFERDTLDFKRHPGGDDKVKEIWAEALSGMANNEGGLIVWGIDARKKKRPDDVEVDAACGMLPITKLRAFEAMLRGLCGDMTDPPVGGLETELAEDPGNPGTGCLLCYIPEGDFKPYRGDARNRKSYYVRLGDRFEVLSTSMLRTMFYPQSRSSFELTGELYVRDLRSARVQASGFRIESSLTLKCIGPATARDMFVLVRADTQGWFTPALSSSSHWVRDDGGAGTLCAYRTIVPLHPGSQRQLCHISVEVGEHPGRDGLVVPSCSPPRFSLTIHANDQLPQAVELIFDLESARTAQGCKAAAVAAPFR